MPHAWNGWYHCTGSTYGTWLRGDPRGFRTKDHRMHVEGDYKRPPPAGMFDRLHGYAKSVMPAPEVRLNENERGLVCDAMVAELLAQSIDVLAIAVDDHHFHVLAKFPDSRPRHWIGLAKRRASLMMQAAKQRERLWALRSRAEPIRDRAHQLNVFNYIVRHGERDAAVWTFRDSKPVRHPHAGTEK